jgi:hypothetical protein
MNYDFYDFSEGNKGNVLFTHAIGETYLNNFYTNSFPFFKMYCIKNKIDLIVFKQFVNDEYNVYWQKCFYPEILHALGYISACYLDTDIIINPNMPNLFEVWDNKKFGVVSTFKNLPFNISPYEIRSRIARLRNSINKNYPLNTSLTASFESIYKLHSLENLNDYVTTGFFLFNTCDFTEFLQLAVLSKKKWAIDQGEEIYLNTLLIHKNTHFLDYKFQALWIYEMAYNYPFLYSNRDDQLVIDCISACLSNNYILHFAGSWESWAWHLSPGVLEKFIETSETYNHEFLSPEILDRQIKPSKK